MLIRPDTLPGKQWLSFLLKPYTIVCFKSRSIIFYCRFISRKISTEIGNVIIFGNCVCSEKNTMSKRRCQAVYLELVYLVTALVPSETACLANSPGKRRRTAVWISLEVMVDRLL